MFFELCQKGVDLRNQGTPRRIPEEGLERLTGFLHFAKTKQRLPEDQFGRTGGVLPESLALRYGDLRLTARFFVSFLVKVGVGQQIVRRPIVRIREHGSLQSGAGGGVVFQLQVCSSQQSQCSGGIGAQARRRRQIGSRLRVVLLHEVQVSQKEVQVRIGRRQLIRRV